MYILSGLICFCMCAGGYSEILDFLTVYRIDESRSVATQEFHKMTNTRGFIFRTEDYSPVVPSDSTRGLHSFVFDPADASCYKTGLWSMQPQDISGEEKFTIITDERLQFEVQQPDSAQDVSEGLHVKRNLYSWEEKEAHFYRNCAVNNGGCRVICSEGSCQCPSEFQLNVTSTSCYSDSSRSEVHENFFGHEIGKYQHLIIAPENLTIKATVTTKCGDCSVNVYEYRSSSRELRDSVSFYTTSTIESTSNILLLEWHSYYQPWNRWEFTYAVKRSLLTLSSASGELVVKVHPTLPYLCLTVVSKPVMNSSQLFVEAKSNSKEFPVPRSRFRKIGSWTLDFFEMPLETREPLTLSVIVSGSGSVIHSILECNEGGLEVTPMKTVPVSSLPNMEKTSVLKKDEAMCQNRGIYVPGSGSCNCIPGFIGSNCEQACGPNSYGNDCKVRCSMFDRGCSGMIFCKKNLPCICAPGYEGELCNNYCSFGFYGASCQNICGKCKSGTCDIYTGDCQDGCLEGFYPPLCQDTYKYSTEAPIVSFNGFHSVSLTLNNTAMKGRGIISHYQVQCREISRFMDWLEYPPQVYSSEMMTTNVSLAANVTGLNPGVTYEARIIFYSEDGNSYQNGDAVPKVLFSTLCEIPESREYNLKIEEVSSTYFVIGWKYVIAKEYSCHIIGYEITFHKDWEKVLKNVSAESNSVEFSGLLSGEKYVVEVQAFTSFGRAPISNVLEVETHGRAPRHVRDLRVIPVDDTRLSVSWNQPRVTGDNITEYVVEYECTKRISDFENCGCSYHNQLQTTQTSIDLVGLHPFTQYIIKVAGKTESLGPYSFTYGATKGTVPSMAPEPSSAPVVSRTNSSFTVAWRPPSACKSLNGFKAGYHYEMQSLDGKTLLRGNTSDTTASFKNLTPQTNYLVQVFVMNTMGWNKSNALDINVTTAASVPEAVQDLVVYKRARRLLGLRWAAPKETYGEIKSFTISYRHGNGKELSERVLPVECIPWPNYFCHTIQNLVPNRRYSVTVGARNEHIDADGQLTNISSITLEGAPDSPETLTLVQRTSTTASLQWSPPFMFNGVLRSFVINVEQIDAANSSDCCDYYPVQEVPVKEEQQYYNFQATDLKPASKYSIGVASKTITIGSSSNLTVNTPPVEPELQPPVFQDGLVQLPSPFEYPGVDSIYLLLVLPSFEITTSEIWDAEVRTLLQEAVNGSFYVVKEFQYEDLMEEPEVELGTGAQSREGILGPVQDPELTPGEYRVGLAALLDYAGAKTVGFAASEPFLIEG